MTRNALKFNRRIIAALLAAVVLTALLARLWFAFFGPEGFGPPPPPLAREDVSQIKRVLIISVDGLRPDLLLRARTPRIRSLMERGSYSMWARTTEVSITLPSHMTMLTGARPEYHRIFWNGLRPDIYPDVPTIFEQAKLVNLSTGMVAGKSKFHEMAKPSTIDYVEVYRDGEGTDLAVGESAAHMIRQHAPQVLFVHLPNVDTQGHGRGWGSPDQVAAIELADHAVGVVLDALSAQQLLRETLIILSADHGGQGRADKFGAGSHGANDPRSRHIPWIAAGPGIKRNFDLTRWGKLVINTEDTFATACTLMHIPLPEHLDGKFVEEIVDREELLLTVTDTASSADKPADVDEWWKPPAYRYEPTIPAPHHN